jgi:hypothetical protein
MFVISGTYHGNFLRSHNGRIKPPPDLSYFDFRNYKGAIPRAGEINLIVQKVVFEVGSVSSSHLMISLCILARDGVGRDGFFSGRFISPEVGNFSPNEWFIENIAKLYRYMRNDAPLRNGAITHIPESSSSKLIDFSGLVSAVDSKRIGYFNVNWLSEDGINFILHFLNERLLNLPSFTLVFGNDAKFEDDLDKKICDWYEEYNFQIISMEEKRKQVILRRRLTIQKQAEEEEFWDFLYHFADFSCLILMILLALYYLLFSLSAFAGFDLLTMISFVAFLIAAGRLFFKILAHMTD